MTAVAARWLIRLASSLAALEGLMRQAVCLSMSRWTCLALALFLPLGRAEVLKAPASPLCHLRDAGICASGSLSYRFAAAP